MTTRVNLDAMKVAFSSTENAALSGVINGMISKFTSMGGSFLAKKGDMDPKKFILASSMIASFNSLLTLGLLCSVPGVMPYLTGFTAMSGALAGSLGSAAGVNIFNHMAKGPSKGLVATKNSNQDMIADMCGMPLAMLLTRVAGVAGMNPYIFTVATLGPLLAFCTLKSASSIRMDPLHQANVEKIADNYISKNEVPVADTRGIFNTFKSLFSGDSKEYSKKINFADSFESLLGDGDKRGSKERLFSIFKDENYMVNCKGDDISILFRNKAGVDDILKGYIHARLLEKALSGKMDKNLKELYGDDASTALVELSYRAMPANMRFTDELTAKGWHSGAVKIDVKKLDTSWNGQDKVLSSGIDIKKFLELSENPSGEELKKLLDYAYGSSNSEKTGEIN